MPVVAVLVEGFAELAVWRPVGLHGVGVLQGGALFLETLLTAVRGAAAHRAAARQRRARDLLTVHLARRPLQAGRRHGRSSGGSSQWALPREFSKLIHK